MRLLRHREPVIDPPAPTAEDWSVAAAAFGAVFEGQDFSEWTVAAMVGGEDAE